jgi:hypothetical protein
MMKTKKEMDLMTKEKPTVGGKATSDAVTTSSDEDDQDGEDDGIGGRAFGEHPSNPTGDGDNDNPKGRSWQSG